MPSNLKVYQAVESLKNCLEIQDENGKQLTWKEIKEVVELINKVFSIVERRRA